jgi:C1A family cysteine protease
VFEKSREEVKSMRNRMVTQMRALTLLVIVILSFTAIPVGAPDQPYQRAPDRPPQPVVPMVSMTLDQIREMIRANNYGYTVGDTWVYELPPEERANLLGYVPPPQDLSHLEITEENLPEGSLPRTLPSIFDYRTLGKVTPVRNQGACGSCWAFSGVGALESRILMEGGAQYDLSEENLLSCNVYKAGCGGGNELIVANYLTKFGASLESCAHYDAADGTPCKSCEYVRKLSGFKIIGTNLDSAAPSKVNQVKQALLDYGPLIVTMDASGPGFSAYTGGVYEWWSPSTENHGVLLIGWNDTLTHSHGSGAWIVKNSWGTYWGESGYFAIAYGSAMICHTVSAVSLSRSYNTSESTVYYDEYGWRGSFGAGTNTCWGAVRFTPPKNGLLKRVEFWATGNTVSYQIYVYDNMYGSGPYIFNALLASQSGSTTKAGYCSVRLVTPPQVYSGDDIYIAIRFYTPGWTYPVPIDNHTPITNRSYASLDGVTWDNLTEGGSDWDIGIRTVIGDPPAVTFSSYPGLFSTNSFFVVGDTAYCTDVLGTGKISYGLAVGGLTENPEGRTDLIITQTEHDTGNLIIVGGPAVSPIADEFDGILGITYNYNPGVQFDIFCEGETIHLNLTQYPAQDICVVYLGVDNGRNVMVIWGYGWEGTYAGSVLVGNPNFWTTYQNNHLMLVRWVDGNSDGLVQSGEITVEKYI